MKRASGPWAGIDAALDAWIEQRRELDARLTALLGRPAMRDGEPVSRIEVDEHGRLLARLERAGVVHARDAKTLIERATEVVEARRAAQARRVEELLTEIETLIEFRAPGGGQ